MEIEKEQEALRPAASVAVHKTWVTPAAKAVPDAGLQLV